MQLALSGNPDTTIYIWIGTFLITKTKYYYKIFWTTIKKKKIGF